MLSEKMVQALHDKVVADGLQFPVHVTLEVAGEAIEGFVYEDGHFSEGSEPEAPERQDGDADGEGDGEG